MISEQNQQLINSLILCSLAKVNYYVWYLILDWISIRPHKQYAQNNDISGLSILCVIFHWKRKWLVAVNDQPLRGFVCIAILSPITNRKSNYKEDMRKRKNVKNYMQWMIKISHWYEQQNFCKTIVLFRSVYFHSANQSVFHSQL